MSNRYAGKVLVVTGAARGIGAGVARAYAAEGGTVALLGLEPDLDIVAEHRDRGRRELLGEQDDRAGGGVAHGGCRAPGSTDGGSVAVSP